MERRKSYNKQRKDRLISRFKDSLDKKERAMTPKTDAYMYNLFAYPSNYFKEHTADDLKLSEEERSYLIREQEEFEERKKANRHEEYKKADDERMSRIVAILRGE